MTVYKKNIVSIATLVLLMLLILPAAFSQNYFQQQVNYRIDVKLNDINHTLSAFEEMEYINNSPDVLNEIWIHLWPNAYRNNNSALVKQQVEDGKLKLFFAEEKERGFIDSLDFKIDSLPVKFEFKELDYGRLKLPHSLLPGQKIKITTPFYVKIPSAKFSRLGHNKQAYYISQWYPKPAVYDSKGWHPMPYLDQGEFYSEFGNYHVTIELPENYVVGATGELNDTSEIEWLLQKVEETAKIDSFGQDMSFPASSDKTKKLTYIQNDVHDFAWFADKRWHVLKGEVLLPNSGHKVTTWAMFTNNRADLWKKGIQYINNTLYDYSLWNGDYIYNQCTVVDGVISAGTGMEYPTITIIGGESDSFMLDVTIAHEVGHNWFYGMLGSNERDHPWLDEGINSFNEMRYVFKRYPKSIYGNRNELMGIGNRASRLLGLDNLDYKEAWQLEYNVPASVQADQPIEGKSISYTSSNYGLIVYRKTGIELQYLRQYLGDTIFDSCMKQYFNLWKVKHPYPENFKEIFTSCSGKSLDWFFDDVLTTTKKIDYKISGIKHAEAGYDINLCNKGGLVSPLELHGLKNDSVITTIKLEGFAKRMQQHIECETCDAFEIDHLHDMPDVNRSNNIIRSKGLLKKIEPLSIHLLPKFETKIHTNINLLPSIGKNVYNGFMVGMTLYNKFLPVKKFEYAVTALYGLSDQQIAGCGSLNYNIYKRSGCFDFIGLSLAGKRFAYQYEVTRKSLDKFESVHLHYSRLEPTIEFSIRSREPKSSSKNHFGISAITLFKEETALEQRVVVNDSTSYNITSVVNNSYQTLRVYFEQKNKRELDPFSFKVQYEGNMDYGKLSFTSNLKFNYKKSNKGVNCRVFAGAFVYNDEQAPVQYPYNLSAWDGPRDYWADDYYFGRSETSGFWSQQMSMNEGGFKASIPYARVNAWMATLNIKADLPGILPIKAFIDIGTFKDAKNHIEEYNDVILFDAGICISLVDDALECYFPFLLSKGINQYKKDNEIKTLEQIRFVINLNMLNPLNLRNKIIQ